MTSQDAASLSVARSMKRTPSSPRTLFSSVMTGVACLCAAIALIPLVAVLTYVVINGFSRLSPDIFVQLPPAPGLKGGGFGNALVGTLLTVGLAAAFSIPFGVIGAIYLSEYARDTKLANVIDFFTNVLSGVPSIVVGAFAYSVVVLTTGTFSAVAGGVALAVLMLPTIVRTSAEALEAVPNDFRQAAVGLGATRTQTTLQIVLPAAVPAITTGIMLAIARAAGETAPVLFTASFNRFWNTTLWQPTATMSRLVFDFATAPYKNQQELAWAGSLVLVALVLVTSILSRIIIRRR
ncbi:phosphate ABC transporter permease PstA [Leptolyngbya sp. FACHB-36]|uniref:phosphate ABC transporter permease PstA n=1 Tax=Leptolyngbya sp. FACHB-36 TaxID=2692808 RepID=UPI001680A92F|nr:phosphate ABC transporter permease PstA [Leptolyngbya sp. FACHB-36]MBD2019636.1 phosphate ABC transporter permease PstA [Leptolyngbya sp. FACHB-36]